MHKAEMFVIVTPTIWIRMRQLRTNTGLSRQLPNRIASELGRCKIKGEKDRRNASYSCPISPPLSMTHLFQCLQRMT